MTKVAILFLTPHCNMHCDFCGAASAFDSMSYAQAKGLIDRLAGEGVESVVLGGGEAFLWKEELFHLARHARQAGLITQVGTNGTLAPAEDEALHEFDRWILPLESVSGEIHDGMRHFPGGHLHKVIHLMERLKRRKIEVTISSLVTPENSERLNEVGAFLAWYKKSGGRLHAWHLYRFMPVGRGGSLHGIRFGMDLGLFTALGTLLKSRYNTLNIYLRPDMYHSKKVSFYWFEGGALQCFSGTETAAAR